MTEVKLIKLKFRQGQKQTWLSWAEELKHRRNEVIATLKNEGVVSEACFISEDGEYVYYFMEAEDFEKANRAVAEHPLPIDSDHRQIRQNSLERIAQLDCLFHFENRM